MLTKKKPLYLAKTLAELQTRIEKKNYGNKLEMLCRVSDTLFTQIDKLKNASILDEELLFIISSRYLLITESIRAQVKDDRFYVSRFSKSVSAIMQIKSDTVRSLDLRYDMCMHAVEPMIMEVPDSIIDTTPQIIKNGDMFVSCDTLYNLITNNGMKLLLIDARSEHNYIESRIKYPYVMNIPNSIICQGLSTNTLQQKIKDDHITVFKQRHSYDVIVLYDFDSTKVSFVSTKLEELRCILVDWDLEEKYKTLPVVLDGGLRLWTETYPTYVTNPAKIFNTFFDTFDDMIMDIDYPDYEHASIIENNVDTNVIKNVKPPETKIITPPTIESKYSINTCLLNIKTVAELMLDNEQTLLEHAESRCLCYDLMMQNQQLVQIKLNDLGSIIRIASKAESFKIELHERRNILENELKTHKTQDDIALIEDALVMIKNIDNQRGSVFHRRKYVESKEATFKLQMKNVEYMKLHMDSSNDELVPIKPQIPDRKMKPITQSSESELNSITTNVVINKDGGVVGLMNLNNSCYVNTLIQCLRNLIPFLKYMVTTNFSNKLRHKMPLTIALSELLKLTWKQNKITLRPLNFLNEVRKACPTYAKGKHEDVQEFLLFMINTLNEELSSPVEITPQLSARAKDFYQTFNNKSSIIPKMFYYQVEVISKCSTCNTSIVRYEYGNTLFITLPTDGSAIRIEEQVRNFLDVTPEEAKTCSFCKSCEKQMTLHKRISYHPTILPVNIIRYDYCLMQQRVIRSDNECHTPDNVYFGSQKYALKSISLHTGNRNVGHYTALAFHPFMRRWFEYNDHGYTSVDSPHETDFRIKCYLLFYTLIQNPEDVNRNFFQAV